MTPKDNAPRSWFATIVGSAMCLGGIVAHGMQFMGNVVTITVIVIGAALIDGSRITSVVRARFGGRTSLPNARSDNEQ